MRSRTYTNYRSASYAFSLGNCARCSITLLILLLVVRLNDADVVTSTTRAIHEALTVDVEAGSSKTFECGPVESGCEREWAFTNAPDDRSQMVRDPINVSLSSLRTRKFANIEISSSDSLSITGFASNNAGNYTCSIRCGAQLQAQTTWQLRISDATVQLRRAKANRAFTGSSLLLECLSSDPERLSSEGGSSSSSRSKFGWTKDGVPIEQLDEFHQRVLVPTYSIDYSRQFDTIRSNSSLPKMVVGLNGKLLIRNLTTSDEAVYACSRLRGDSASTSTSTSTSSPSFDFDFAQVRLVGSSSQSLTVDVEAISAKELLVARSLIPKYWLKNSHQLDMDSIVENSVRAQRFYLRSLGEAATIIENADVNAVPLSLGNKNERSAVSSKRFEFLEKMGGGTSRQTKLAAATNFTAKAFDGSRGWEPAIRSVLDVGVRVNEDRFDIDPSRACYSQSLPAERLAACREDVQPGAGSTACSCALEQSYEVMLYFDFDLPESIRTLSGLSGQLIPVFTARPLLFRVLVSVYNETVCAQLGAALPSFSSFRQQHLRVADPPSSYSCHDSSASAPASSAASLRQSVESQRPDDDERPAASDGWGRSSAKTSREIGGQFLVESNDGPNTNDLQSGVVSVQQVMLVVAMVICGVLVFALVLFVAVHLTRMRNRVHTARRLKLQSPLSQSHFQPHSPNDEVLERSPPLIDTYIAQRLLRTADSLHHLPPTCGELQHLVIATSDGEFVLSHDQQEQDCEAFIGVDKAKIQRPGAALQVDTRVILDTERHVDMSTPADGDCDADVDADGEVGVPRHLRRNEVDHDSSSASASSGGATTNTSCFCSTNVSLDSRELLGTRCAPE